MLHILGVLSNLVMHFHESERTHRRLIKKIIFRGQSNVVLFPTGGQHTYIHERIKNIISSDCFTLIVVDITADDKILNPMMQLGHIFH